MQHSFVEALVVVTFLSSMAYLGRFLDLAGSIAAFLVGFTIYWLGGYLHFLVLLIFFIVSSLFTKYRYSSKYSHSIPRGVRGWRNVVGNGVVASASLVIAYLTGVGEELAFVVYLGSVAAAFADTMATEVGMLGERPPRSIVFFKPVDKGSSGGVSALGYGGAVLAALILWLGVALLSPLLNPLSNLSLTKLLAIVAIASLLGSTVDSVVGALFQAKYRCAVCGSVVESRIHCGANAERIGGYALINNDVVNVIATLVGALAGYVVFMLW